jgi:phosphoribosyl 1,2-cyclic phosphodiesterase
MNGFVFSRGSQRLHLPLVATLAATSVCSTFTTSTTSADSSPTTATPAWTTKKAKKEKSDAQSDHHELPVLAGRTGLMFVGTGSSTGCPKPLCSMIFAADHHHHHHHHHATAASTSTTRTSTSSKDKNEKLRQLYQDRCKTSRVAAQGDPRFNKNYRNNPALLISLCNDNNDNDKKPQCHNILIDAGKTFREGSLRWFPYHSIHSLDAIVLTHHHMDAAGGLDDVRGFQSLQTTTTTTTTSDKDLQWKLPLEMIPMPLHLSSACLADVSERFPWLFPNQQPNYTSGTENNNNNNNNNNTPMVQRHVASFQEQVFHDFEPIQIPLSSEDQSFSIVPLPVWHGDDLISYGFAFTIHHTHIVYISDISRMPSKTLQYIQTQLPPTDILIVDALEPRRDHPVHYSLLQAQDLARTLGAKQTWIIGMNCDSFPLHDAANEQLLQQQQQTQSGDIKVQLAHDGQIILL